jgi:hypothetical protein
MSAKVPTPPKRSRWLEWKPKDRAPIGSVGAESPTTGFVGFVGAGSGESAEMDPEPPGGSRHPDVSVPGNRIFEDPPEIEPAKPSKLGSEGFVGTASSKSAEIDAERSLGDLHRDHCPPSRISDDLLKDEPTRPSEPGSVGFAGDTPAESQEIEQSQEEIDAALKVLNRAGVRLMELGGGATIGLWSDLDGPEVRAALHTFGLERLPMRYLDGGGVPMRYKARCVEGEPAPMNVLNEMEQHPEEPWKVRDRMLNQMGWCAKGTPWAEWRAAALNSIFKKQGVTGTPGRITAETVRRGVRTRRAKTAGK